jgi:hypothetical protein
VNFLRLILLLSCIFFYYAGIGQKGLATVSGKVLDGNEKILSNVSVTILGLQKGAITNDSGYFKLRVPAGKAFALIFSFTGYKTAQQNFLLNEGEDEQITIRLSEGTGTLQEVIVTDQRDRTEAGLIKPNPKNILNLPSPVTGVESLIKNFGRQGAEIKGYCFIIFINIFTLSFPICFDDILVKMLVDFIKLFITGIERSIGPGSYNTIIFSNPCSFFIKCCMIKPMVSGGYSYEVKTIIRERCFFCL